mmetsp:Transcript_29799/g.41171  ORF Transcript_29799/g.41171 Transcript_29799/m.41171 type:complete len:454 (+) Transcript_29799:86-1447(+)|eukprot:CAMPEP_0196584086 /NCGR_PEP_ID=MMETSP1081-20130531/45741_1 /TAXON_ID=36882 /ORGANISM="Pyramimonas amylifera, Strain CCMP720" /LENGTH=453 /DNA_ID=CAMNT_0041905175 /DNA_START=86 /DNA_END=1447 /DNA_ORIENTATION=-
MLNKKKDKSVSSSKVKDPVVSKTTGGSSSKTKHKLTKTTKATKVSTKDGDPAALQRVFKPPLDEAYMRAEGGEMSSDTIIDALNSSHISYQENPESTNDKNKKDNIDSEAANPRALDECEGYPAGEDPWGQYSRQEEWEALEEEKAMKVVIEEVDCHLGGRGVDTSVEAKVREKLGDCGRVALVMTECNLTAVPMSGHTRSLLVQLDLTNNALPDIYSLTSSGFLWLRELKLTGNKLKGWPAGFEALPALLSLDLSFNTSLSLAGADLTPLAGLWKLDLAGCGLDSLTGSDDQTGSENEVDCPDTAATPLSALTSLTDLNLSENEFTRLGALEPLKNIPQLRILDVQENEELCEVRQLKQKMLAMLPRLVRLNGDGTGMGSGQKYRGPVNYLDSGTGTVFGSNVDRSSCSCVEGNPCAFPDSCLNWKGRYTVAMIARKNKGYDPGVRGVQYNM